MKLTDNFKSHVLGLTLQRYIDVIHDICRLIGFSHDNMFCLLQDKITQIGYDDSKAMDEFIEQREAYASPHGDTFIPFESYQSYFVWNAFSQVIDEMLRNGSIDKEVQPILHRKLRIYDPCFPFANIQPKPEDICIPSFNTVDKEGQLLPDVESWMSFEGIDKCERWSSSISWFPLFDKYQLTHGRFVEECFASSYLIKPDIAEKINDKNEISNNLYILQLGDTETIPKITIHEAKSILQRIAFPNEFISRSEHIPLIALHHNEWWFFRETFLAGLIGPWIRHLGLRWEAPDTLNMTKDGNVFVQSIQWQDGVKADLYKYMHTSMGNRLSIYRELIDSIIHDFNLVFVTSYRINRTITEPEYGKDSLSSEKTIEFIKIYS